MLGIPACSDYPEIRVVAHGGNRDGAARVVMG
jgi:hypothetical protein